jgi:hypothetical protein
MSQNRTGIFRFDSRRKVADRMRADNYSETEIAKVLAADNRSVCTFSNTGYLKTKNPPFFCGVN